MSLTSLEKSLKVIEALSKNPHGMSLTELAEKVGLPGSSVHHILSTFVKYDYVFKEPETRKYSLGYRFLKLSDSILSNIDVRRIAKDSVLKLSEEADETVHIYILRNGWMTVIDMIPKKKGLSLSSYIGWTTEPHASAAGKVLLSGLPDKELAEMYKDKTLKQYGKNTITSVDRLMEEIRNVRKLGWALDNEEYYEGIRCVAAPIRSGSSGKIVAALSVTGSIFSLTMSRIDREIIRMVRDTAEKISMQLQW